MSDNWTGTWCPQCGHNVRVDEDGCCTGCGSTSVGDGCEEALRALVEVKTLRDRLQFDPGGSDRIDELEQAVQFLRFGSETLQAERDAERDRVRRLAMGEAEAMALAMSHEGHIAKLESEVAQLKRWLDDAHLARASEQDEASAQRAELLKEADKYFAGARAVLEDALGEGERRAVICETCDGEGWLHEDPIVDGAVPACPDCGKDGCGPGVRWEK